MSQKTQNGAIPQHAFFRAMVLMGGSLAVNCGGTTSDGGVTTMDKSGVDAGGSSGSTSTSTGGAVLETGGTGGSEPGTGGGFIAGGASSTGGTGGTLQAGSGGGGISGAGNYPATDAGTAVDAGVACPPTQWNCGSAAVCGGDAWALPNECPCDPTRPQSAADCHANQSFVCRIARYDSSYNPLDQEVQFECACIPQPDNCGTACDALMLYAGGGPWSCTESTVDGRDEILCECAIVLLR